jgi:hypothetical protein
VTNRRAEAADSKDLRAILIMDDCPLDKRWASSEHMRELILNGRHLHILVLLLAQTPPRIPPIWRANIDYLFLMNQDNPHNRKLFDDYGCTMVDTRAKFYGLLAARPSSRTACTNCVFSLKK